MHSHGRKVHPSLSFIKKSPTRMMQLCHSCRWAFFFFFCNERLTPQQHRSILLSKGLYIFISVTNSAAQLAEGRWVQTVIIPIGCSRHEITSIWYFDPSPTNLPKSKHMVSIRASKKTNIIKRNRAESSRMAPDWFPLSFFHHGPQQHQCAHLPHQWSPRYSGPPAQHHEDFYKSNSDKVVGNSAK